MTSTTTAIALPWVVLVSIVSFFALLGNIIVVIVIIHDRIKKGPNYTLALVCNIAISDALYVGVATPLILASAFMRENWILGNFGCKLMMFLPNFCIASSIYTMVFIAFDRRVTILTNKPRTHKKSRMYLVPLLVWFMSLVVAAPAFYEYSVYKRPLFVLSDDWSGESSEEVDDDAFTNRTGFYLACGSFGLIASFEKVYASILFAVAYVLPLVIITINYALIARFLMKRRSVVPIPEAATDHGKPGSPSKDNLPIQWSNSNPVSPGQGVPMSHFHPAGCPPEDCSKTTFARKEDNAVPKGTTWALGKPKTFVQKVSTGVIKMLLVLVVMFAISWAPYFVLFVREEVTGADDTANFGKTFHVIKLLASLITCLLNPIIYAVFNSRIKKGIMQLMCPNVSFSNKSTTTTDHDS